VNFVTLLVFSGLYKIRHWQARSNPSFYLWIASPFFTPALKGADFPIVLGLFAFQHEAIRCFIDLYGLLRAYQ
jgi:hypothetical protein